MDSEQRCGTCADWGRDSTPRKNVRTCLWPERNLPMWMAGAIEDIEKHKSDGCTKWSKRDD